MFNIKEWYLKNKKEIRAKQKEYYLKNKEIFSKHHNEYYKNHKEEIKKNQQQYAEKNRTKIKKHKKEYYEKNKIKILSGHKKYNQEHKLEILKQQQEYRLKPEVKEYQRKYNLRPEVKIKQVIYQKNRRRTDIDFRIVGYLRGRIWHALKGICKSKDTITLIGCNINQLRKHLEAQFISGMNWDNWGTGNNGKGMKEWHIDHIRPCVSFDLSKPEEQRRCFHYTNLRPLWAKENLERPKNK